MTDWDHYQAWVFTRVNLGKSSVNPDVSHELLGYLGLAGEAGEVVDLGKKKLMHGKIVPREKFIEELGDVFWYLALLLQVHGTTLEEVLAVNQAKLLARDGLHGEKFDEARR